jgi:lipopolysaccharide transport system ATP-binding protein
MAEIVIKVENLSKQYRLGDIGTGSIAHDVNRWWYTIRGKEDPYLKIGEENDRTITGTSDYVWALKDIDFEVEKGKVLGIIGRNGAGKSTLLKILSKTTTPTKGRVKIKGRVASLLEVGTGFHPELTGRDNVFLNGAILGMTRREIKTKFNEIVEFAGVERYIDTPVKRYSSGMYVRLAFAVAAHLEPEILIVDEVLAVGDAEFQKKCLGKMKDVSVNYGRTVLFVSHNMAAVKTLCNSALVIEHGKVKFNGDTAAAVSFHLKGHSEMQNRKKFDLVFDNDYFTLHEISLNPKDLTPEEALTEDQEIELHANLTIKSNPERLHFTYVLSDEEGEPLFTFSHISTGQKFKVGFNHLVCTFPKGFLNVGSYYLAAYLIEDAKNTVFVEKDIISFNVQFAERNLGGWMGREPGFIKPLFKWDLI